MLCCLVSFQTKLSIKSVASVSVIFAGEKFVCLFQPIDLTDYSRLPNGLVSMFVPFSLASAGKGYVPTFSFFVVQLKPNQ